MSHTAVQKRTEKAGKKVVEALKNHYFEAYYCATKEEAKEKAVSLVPEGNVVSWGGSVSIEELGLPDSFRNGNYTVIDRDTGKDEEAQVQLMRQALLCDTFLMGTNALSEDGQLVNIDGRGNRVAALAFGPKQVIVIAGINKLVHSAEDAVTRARTIAAPTNLQRFEKSETPCQRTGTCGNCTAPGCICTQIVLTRQSKPANRIKVIVVGEELGF